MSYFAKMSWSHDLSALNYISNTEARYNNALFFIKLYTADEEKITKTGN